MATIKNRLNGLAGHEAGAVLIMALVAVVIGALLLTPLLGLMGTGLMGGEVYEEKMYEIYAADAGVEDAIWKLQNPAKSGLPHNGCNQQQQWDPPYEYPVFGVNERNVWVTINYEYREAASKGVFTIESEAFALDDTEFSNPLTTIVSIVTADWIDGNDENGNGENENGDNGEESDNGDNGPEPLNFSGLLDYALSSEGRIRLQPGSYVSGDIYIGDGILETRGQVTHDGEVFDSNDTDLLWPTAEDLSGYYWKDVSHLESQAYPDGYVMSIPGGHNTELNPYPVGPLLATGGFTITGSGWIRLDGTVYVEDSLFINPDGVGIHIILNGATVFAKGEIQVNPHVHLHGSGCIIAVEDIQFQPNLGHDEDGFVLVLSLEGQTKFQPSSGNFYGAIAGESEVWLNPGTYVEWIPWGGEDLNFPVGGGGGNGNGDNGNGNGDNGNGNENDNDNDNDNDSGEWDRWEVETYIINPDAG